MSRAAIAVLLTLLALLLIAAASVKLIFRDLLQVQPPAAGSAQTSVNLASESASAAPEVALPPGWPLPDVAPPPGSRRARLVIPAQGGAPGDGYSVSGEQFNRFTAQSGSMWRVGFAFDGGFDQAAAALEQLVAPQGYYLYWTETGRGREYISPDGRYIVQIYYWPGEQAYQLSISRYDEPWRDAPPALAG